MSLRHALSLLAAFALTSCNCGESRLVNLATGTGSLRVTLVSARADANGLEIELQQDQQAVRDQQAPIQALPLIAEVSALKAGSYDALVTAASPTGTPLQNVTVRNIEIFENQRTEITLDLSTGEVVTDCGALPLCAVCVAGSLQAATDDARCGAISCAGLDTTHLNGANTATGLPSCVKVAHDPLVSARCAQLGSCLAADGAACTATHDEVLLQAGLCHTIDGCAAGAPTLVTAADGTPCGSAQICQSGQCIGADAGAPVPGVGCSDGTREGFLSTSAYPDLAGCSGAWTVPGVTRPNLVPTCGRASGNAGANPEGTGCSAADLCQDGWHVCLGQAEVGLKSGGSCADAVPPGTLDKMLFFAVSQASQSNTTCDVTGDNDVFGCGNLGTELLPAKNCGVLTRALASTQPGTCGYNEAEPGLGPFQCLGGSSSHLHEGALVTKSGCPGTSCSYNGLPIGSADKGGVLCCRD